MAKLSRVFIVREAGPFRVIPGGKPEHEPADPQGSLYPAEDGQSEKEQLQVAVKYVISSLREFETKIAAAPDEQIRDIALDMMDTQSDLLWAIKKVLNRED